MVVPESLILDSWVWTLVSGLLVWIPGFGSLGLDSWVWTRGFGILGLDSWIWSPRNGFLGLDS